MKGGKLDCPDYNSRTTFCSGAKKSIRGIKSALIILFHDLIRKICYIMP